MNVPFSLSFLSCLMLSQRECKPGVTSIKPPPLNFSIWLCSSKEGCSRLKILFTLFGVLYFLLCRNLESNPFICNCHLAWFPEWLRRRQLTIGYVRCDTPLTVKDSLIYELSSSQFKCASESVLVTNVIFLRSLCTQRQIHTFSNNVQWEFS